MVKIEDIAAAALAGDSLYVRSLVQDFLRKDPQFVQVARPVSTDERILALSASLLELFAERAQQLPPTWTTEVGALSQPIFLLKAAQHMRRLRELCQAESPEPLRKRHLYAAPGYLDYA